MMEYRKLTDRKWLNLFEVSYSDKSGKARSWDVVTRRPQPKFVTGEFEVPDAVIIVPYHLSQQKLVITREYRVPLADYEYSFPAGLVDPGETPRAAAGRELKEETGLAITRVLRNSPALYASAGMTDESIMMVYVECEGEPSMGVDESEDIEVLLVSPHEMGQLCQNTALKFDAKAWLVMDGFAKTGHI